MKIIGIDPGSITTGYGIIKYDGNLTSYIKSGCINVPKSITLPNKLMHICNEIQNLLNTIRPDCASIEEIFFARNAKSALILGYVRGAIMLKMAENNLPVYEYSPLLVKKSIVGVGRASKNQVIHMVKILLNQKKILKKMRRMHLLQL